MYLPTPPNAGFAAMSNRFDAGSGRSKDKGDVAAMSGRLNVDPPITQFAFNGHMNSHRHLGSLSRSDPLELSKEEIEGRFKIRGGLNALERFYGLAHSQICVNAPAPHPTTPYRTDDGMYSPTVGARPGGDATAHPMDDGTYTPMEGLQEVGFSDAPVQAPITPFLTDNWTHAPTVAVSWEGGGQGRMMRGPGKGGAMASG